MRYGKRLRRSFTLLSPEFQGVLPPPPLFLCVGFKITAMAQLDSIPIVTVALLWSRQITQFFHLQRNLYVGVGHFTRLSRQRSTLITLGIFVRAILKHETNSSKSFRITLVHGTETNRVQSIWQPRQKINYVHKYANIFPRHSVFCELSEKKHSLIRQITEEKYQNYDDSHGNKTSLKLS